MASGCCLADGSWGGRSPGWGWRGGSASPYCCFALIKTQRLDSSSFLSNGFCTQFVSRAQREYRGITPRPLFLSRLRCDEAYSLEPPERQIDPFRRRGWTLCYAWAQVAYARTGASGTCQLQVVGLPADSRGVGPSKRRSSTMAASRRIGAVAAAVRVSRGHPPPIRDNAFAN